MQRAEIGRFKLGSILHSRTELMFLGAGTHTICCMYYGYGIVYKRIKVEGVGFEPTNP